MNDLDAWLPAIQAGDGDAFASWLARAERPVRASLRPFAADVDTEAVLQEALLRAWQFAPRVASDGRGNSLLRYTLRTARNLAIDELRRHGRQPTAPLDDPPEPSVDPNPVDPRLADRLDHCLDHLPAQPAAALGRRLAGAGLRHDRELAAEVGMSLNTFLQNVSRARKLLITCLERVGLTLVGGLP